MKATMRPAPARRRGRAQERDSGFTLIEVLVGIGLFTVIMGLLTGLVLETLRTSNGTQNRLSNVDQLRVTMDAVTKELRTAVRPEQLNAGCTTAPCAAAFTAASGSAVTFYANHGVAGGKATLTTFQVQENPTKLGTGQLVQQQRTGAVPTAAPNAACAAGCVTRVLASGLPWPVPASVFTFADEACTSFGPATDLADISCVAVSLPVDGSRDNAGTSAKSTVFLPNSVMGR